MLSNRLAKHFGAAAAAAVVVGSANAAIVCWNVNQAVGATIDGLYMNVETGVTYDGNNADTNFAGWDINPYGSTTMSFFWSAAANGASACVRLNTVAGGTTNGSTCSSLPQGFVISSALVGGASGASFGTGSASFTTTSQGKWSFNALNYFGFRFTNAAGQIRYGYGVMQMGATAVDRTLVRVCYEDSGAGITVVPAPGAMALLGLAGVASRRRRR
ncbi:MAG: PEP-CTERM sorting domain-containing protein [bacterium]